MGLYYWYRRIWNKNSVKLTIDNIIGTAYSPNVTKSCIQEDESTRWEVLNKFAALSGARERDNRWYKLAKWRCTQEPKILTILATETEEISATIDGKKPNRRDGLIEWLYEMVLLWRLILQFVVCWVLVLGGVVSFGRCLCETSPVDKGLKEVDNTSFATWRVILTEEDQDIMDPMRKDWEARLDEFYWIIFHKDSIGW